MNFINFFKKLINRYITLFKHQNNIEKNFQKIEEPKKRINTYIITENKEINEEEEYNLPAWLYTENKKPINNKKLKFTINNNSKTVNPDSTGKYIFPIKLTAGIYTIQIEYNGDEEYNASSITATINVKSKPKEIKPKTSTTTNKPKTVNYNANSKGEYWSPRYLHGQDQKQYRSYWCAPTAITQIWYELFGDNLSQTAIAKIAGTTENGTSHEGINTALNSLAKKYNKKINIEWKNYSNISSNELAQIMANPNKSTLFHVMWHNLNNWDDMGGHYCYYACINPSEKYFYEVYSLSGADLIKRTFNYVKTVTSEISQQSVCIVTKL